MFSSICQRCRSSATASEIHTKKRETVSRYMIFEECCHHRVLQERTQPASKDCYLYKDTMTRLLTSISLRSTLAAVDFLNSLARKPFGILLNQKRNLYLHDFVWYREKNVYNVFCLSVMIYRANVIMHFGC